MAIHLGIPLSPSILHSSPYSDPPIHLLFFSPAPGFCPTSLSFPWHALNLLDILHPVSQNLQTFLLSPQHRLLTFQNPC